MLQRLKRSRQLNDRPSDDSLPSRSLLDVKVSLLRYPVHYPFGSRRARSGLLRKERKKKRTMRVPFVPFTFIMTTPDGAWTYGSLFGR